MSRLPYTHRTTCRLCRSPRVTLAVPIRPTPVADAYVPRDRLAEAQPLFPLDLHLCEDCGHVQLLDVVDPEHLFREYIYSTSISLGLVEHFRVYAGSMVERFSLGRDTLAVDIGSNDGTLLGFFKQHGLRVCGIDPATRIAREATAKGIPTVPQFLTLSVADDIVRAHGPAALVTANNVFAHSDNLPEMADCVARLLGPDGVFIFEVSYLGDIVDRYLFDTVYHEHLCYHSLQPLSAFFHRHGLELFDVERIQNKGGSIRGFVQRKGGARAATDRFKAMLAVEKDRGLGNLETYRRYTRELARIKEQLHTQLATLKAQGKTIAGFGASATVTTLVYNFELAPWMSFLVDDNTSRHGLFSPGQHLPVRPSADIHRGAADVVVILAWQYAQPIMKKHAPFLENGGAFLVPMPSPELITRATLLGTVPVRAA